MGGERGVKDFSPESPVHMALNGTPSSSGVQSFLCRCHLSPLKSQCSLMTLFGVLSATRSYFLNFILGYFHRLLLFTFYLNSTSSCAIPSSWRGEWKGEGQKEEEPVEETKTNIRITMKAKQNRASRVQYMGGRG